MAVHILSFNIRLDTSPHPVAAAAETITITKPVAQLRPIRVGVQVCEVVAVAAEEEEQAAEAAAVEDDTVVRNVDHLCPFVMRTLKRIHFIVPHALAGSW